MVLKRKEIVAASLVLLIGIAGYLNWSYQDSIQVTDGESYIETGKKLGEAQYVSNVEEVEDKAEDDAEEEKSEQTADIEVVSDSDGGFFDNQWKSSTILPQTQTSTKKSAKRPVRKFFRFHLTSKTKTQLKVLLSQRDIARFVHTLTTIWQG